MNIAILTITVVLIVLIVFALVYKTTISVDQFKVEHIPRIIIQTWKTKELTNVVHYLCQKRVKELHPDYQYLYFDDDEMFTFMKTNFPQYWNKFKDLRYKIQQIDIFRLCAVYFYGGIYLDLDIWLFKKIDDMLTLGDLVFPLEFKVNKNECKEWKSKDRFHSLPPCNIKETFTVGNYGFAASKGNPTLKKMIDLIFADYDKTMDTLSKTNRYHLMVYKTTGPDKITEFYYEHPDIQRNMTIIADPSTRACCRMGVYGKHVCTGSWKKESDSVKPVVTI